MIYNQSYTLTQEDLDSFKIKEPYKYEPHSFKGKVCGKQYCVKCGLLSINNDFTRWAVDKGCNNERHPSYQSQRAKTGL